MDFSTNFFDQKGEVETAEVETAEVGPEVETPEVKPEVVEAKPTPKPKPKPKEKTYSKAALDNARRAGAKAASDYLSLGEDARGVLRAVLGVKDDDVPRVAVAIAKTAPKDVSALGLVVDIWEEENETNRLMQMLGASEVETKALKAVLEHFGVKVSGGTSPKVALETANQVKGLSFDQLDAVKTAWGLF